MPLDRQFAWYPAVEECPDMGFDEKFENRK
jgi:hypothetical protein